MSSNDKIKNKAIENSCILLGTCFLFAALLLMFGYYFFEYRFSEILIYYLSTYVCSAIILLYLAFVSVKQLKFYYIFVFLIFLLFLVTFFQCLINGNLKNIFGIIFDTSVWASATILIINNLITRVFFREGDNKNSQDVDAVSSEFAVDVISVSLFFGIIFGTIAYLFFVPGKDIALFFAGIDIKNVAIATAGLVTFFWAAKTAKNKSIELEEKKQDGKRRDKEIKMAESRDTAQLIAKASELLGSENDAQKNAGLAFLNTVASQKGGPLQKEAFDLLADFILSASDTTTSNKPRMRAIGYVNDLLDNQCGNFKINEFIKISGTAGGKLEEGNLAYKFDNLNVQYTGFQFSPKAAFLRNTNQHKAIKLYSNCDFIDFDGKSERGEIDRIYISNCKLENCKINSVHVVSEIKSKAANNLVALMSSPHQNEFIKCNFSNFFSWSTLCPNIYSNPKKNFKDCYFITGFLPYGFDSDMFDGYLVEVSSQDEADKKFSLSTY